MPVCVPVQICACQPTQVLGNVHHPIEKMVDNLAGKASVQVFRKVEFDNELKEASQAEDLQLSQ